MTFLNLIPMVTVISCLFLLHEKLLWIEQLGMGLIMASIYALNEVMIRSESSSNEDEMAKCPIGDPNKGRRSDVYMRAILSFLRL